MTLRDVPFKAAYVSGVDNLVRDFYIPTLAQAVHYQRRTGYFNSRALALAARGLSGLLKNGGRMQLLCSVQLDKDEAEVLKDPVSYLERRALDVATMLEQPYDELEKQRLGVLAHLLANGLLEIRIALRRGGIYHEKAGIFRDAQGNIVAFNGSGNETPGGWMNNTESFHVFTSWGDDRHIRPEIETFERLWEGRDPKTTVIPLPFAVVKGLIEFKDYFREGVDEPVDPMDLAAVTTRPGWQWTPERAYVFEAPRLWNHRDFAYGEVAFTPYEHQDYIASTVLDRWPPRFLFADEVGLGKTIEAGLVLKGFVAAGRIDRCLILAPANVLKQFQGELYAKFGIEAWRLDGDRVVAPQLDPNTEPRSEPADAVNPFQSKPLLMVSSQLLRLDDRKEQLLRLEYDLVILDEAHHARATRGAGNRREPNKLLQVLEELRFQTQGLILMTATPIQLDRRELWDLLNTLELPGQWQDPEAFDRFFEDINSDQPDWKFLLTMVGDAVQHWGIDDAAAREVAEDYPGVDSYRLRHILQERDASAIGELTPEGVEALKLLLFRHTPVRQMVFRNTRELLKRYRAEGKFSGDIAERKTHREVVALAGDAEDPTSERGLYERIDHYVREYYAKYDALRPGLGFIMETYRKRLTSSLHAIKLSLELRQRRLAKALETGNLTLLVRDLDEDDLLDVSDAALDRFASEMQGRGTLAGDELRKLVQAEHDALTEFLRDLRQLPFDSKAAFLDELVRRKISQGTRQIIIFSQFADTVQFLLDYFLDQYGQRLGSYTGAGGAYWDGQEWVRCSKQEIQSKFADPADPLSVLVCTDAASEGLNLQSCDTVINYDVPWNPMRIEQRIGRVDRIGQRSPVVNVHTIFYEDTVEQKAYDRCLERIGYFRSALGHLQPILQATQRAIRNAALAPTPADEDMVLEMMDNEFEQTVPQLDENKRIEQLLNHYSPRLPLMQKRAPISQDELAEVMRPLLEEAGWVRQGPTWSRLGQTITFSPRLRDETGSVVELITPLSSLTALVGSVPELPDVLKAPNGTFHRLTVQGLAGMAVDSGDDVYLAEHLSDLRTRAPSGQRFGSVDEARQGLQHLIDEQRRRYLESERQAWTNRERNWRVRVTMYLDRVAHWRFRSAQKGATDTLTPETFYADWSNYLADKDRALTRQLAELVQYRPGPDVMKRTRGRVPQTSPRDTAREQQMTKELERITRRLQLVEGQLQTVA